MTAIASERGHADRLGASERVVRLITSVWLLVAFFVVWEVWTTNSPSLFVPPMTDIVQRFVEVWLSSEPTQLFLSDQFWADGRASLFRALAGWALAAGFGIGFGLVLGMWRPAAWFCDPIVRFGIATPSTILLPVAILLFGITSWMNIFLIAFGAVWVILVNTTDGVRSLHRTTVLTARSLRLSRTRYFFQILLPGASPQIFTGLRVSIGIALILMVVSELFAASEGVGFYIVHSQRTFRYLDMWSAIFLLGVIGVVANLLFAAAERRILRWHREAFGGGS